MPLIRDDKPHEYADVVARHPELQEEFDEFLDLISQYGTPKLGRWAYCKSCYKNVLPSISFGDGLILCSQCSGGLAPLDRVIKAGSYRQWEAQIAFDFRMAKEIG